MSGPQPETIPASRADDTVIIVPAYREAGGIPRVVREIQDAINPVVLVVNRPADDGTEAAARRVGAIVVDQPGRGKGDAVRIGLEYVRDHLPRTRFIGLVDADCTYPAYPMNSMRTILETSPSVGMVVGQRDNLKNNGVKSEAFAVGNRMLGSVHRVLNHVPLRDPLSGLRMFRAEAVGDWYPRSHGFDIECELNAYVQNVRGLGITEIPIHYRARVGEKKLRFRHGLQILARMVSLALGGARTLATPTTRARSVPSISRQ
jgi:dolichol-phosphate hexosyltransferase